MDQLTGPKQQALQAYEQLHTLKLEALGPVRQHLADQRKTSLGYEILGAVSFLGECGEPDLRVGDVCRMILTWWLDGDMYRCCRYFEYHLTAQDMKRFFNTHTFLTFEDLQLKAAEHALEAARKNGKSDGAFEDLRVKRIQQLRAHAQ
ncbi:MAG: hypothetical protein K8S27_00265 [Candidatus Omnitrophica bacterium]|nr:hypothetical protein [Candidatus Omnitrophota bacterium]